MPETVKSPDGCWITDPDTRVGLLQAQARNMRSKCRCSCVLQFTLCHAFSCVLHRPPSQLIHCIALCLSLVVGLKVRSILPAAQVKLSRGGGSSTKPCRPEADEPRVQGTGEIPRHPTDQVSPAKSQRAFNDPSAGSPTETLLRLLLPLNATVWSSFR